MDCFASAFWNGLEWIRSASKPVDPLQIDALVEEYRACIVPMQNEKNELKRNLNEIEEQMNRAGQFGDREDFYILVTQETNTHVLIEKANRKIALLHEFMNELTTLKGELEFESSMDRINKKTLEFLGSTDTKTLTSTSQSTKELKDKFAAKLKAIDKNAVKIDPPDKTKQEPRWQQYVEKNATVLTSVEERMEVTASVVREVKEKPRPKRETVKEREPTKQLVKAK